MYDLTLASAEALPRWIAVLEALSGAAQTAEALSAALRLPVRSIIGLVAWSQELGLVCSEVDRVALTPAGEVFVSDVEGRPERLREALVAHPWMPLVAQTVAGPSRSEAFAREVAVWSEALAAGAEGPAAPEVEEGVDVEPRVSDDVIRRLRPLVEAAVWPERFDWRSGRRWRPSSRWGLRRPTFVEALTVHLGDSESGLEVSFPSGLSTLVEGGEVQTEGLAARWPEVFGAEGRGLHYGGLPLPLEAASLSGQELAIYAIGTCPFVSLATSLLWSGHRRFGAEEFYVARDLWGLKWWLGGRLCGDLLDVVEDAARELGVRVSRPASVGGGPGLLLDLLSSLGILVTRRTRYVVRPGLVRRMERHGGPDDLWGGPLSRVLAPVEPVLAAFISAISASSR